MLQGLDGKEKQYFDSPEALGLTPNTKESHAEGPPLSLRALRSFRGQTHTHMHIHQGERLFHSKYNIKNILKKQTKNALFCQDITGQIQWSFRHFPRGPVCPQK